MTQLRRRARTALLALPLLAVPLTGCGGDEASAAEVVRAAASTTVESETARMTFELTLPQMPEVGAGTLAGEGAIDFENEIGEMSFDLGPMIEASGDALPPAIDTTIQMVFEGTTYYMRFPMLAEAFGPEALGKEWIKIDSTALAGEMSLDLSQVEQLANDPRQQLAYLTGVSDDIEEVGEEDIRGEATTHYRGTVTIDAVIEHLEGEDAVVDAEQFRRQAEQLGMDEMGFDVWIDDEGRARRMEMAMPTPPEAGIEGGEIDVAMEMYDFGVDIDVQPPSPEETLDVTEMAAQAQGG